VKGQCSRMGPSLLGWRTLHSAHGHPDVEDVFAGQADFAQITKIYGNYGQHAAARTLFAFADDRGHNQDTGRQARSSAHLHQLRRTTKPDHSHGDPALYSPDQCIFKEAGQSQSRLRPALRVLQFLPDTQEPPRDTSNGSWHHGSHMDASGVALVNCLEILGGRLL
jgi:hypothetical protein